MPTLIFWGWRTCLGKPDNIYLVKPVWDMIDWDWIHPEPMAEWCLRNGYAGKLEEDHINTPPRGWIENEGVREMVGHPSVEAQRAFARTVVQPWINTTL